MIRLDSPPFGVGDIIDACEGDMSLLVGARLELSQIESDYAGAILGGTAHSFKPTDYGLADEVADLVDWAYDNRLLSKKSAARDYYNLLRLTDEDDPVCPNCMVREPSALDHYLPREKFPLLAIQPTNLTPICTICNTTKRAKVASGPTDQFLHPYFDDMGSDPWLVANVVRSSPSSLAFELVRPSAWGNDYFERVSKHIDRYDLLTLFAKKAGGLLSQLRLAFETHYVENGPTQVSKEATRLADSEAVDGNRPWKVAALRAWAGSTWFCNGGWHAPDDIALEAAFDRITGNR